MIAGDAFTMPTWRPPRPGGALARTKALAVVRVALAIAPDRADLKRQLAQLLYELDQLGELIDWLRPLVGQEDADPGLLYWLGQAAARRDPILAATALRAAVAAGYNEAFGPLASTLERLDRSDEALAAAMSALEGNPSDFTAMVVAARIHEARSEFREISALCQSLWSRGGRSSQILATEAFANALTGDDRARDRLVDPDRWMSIENLPVDAAFNDQLLRELEAGKSLARLPSTKATIGEGLRLDNVDTHTGEAVRQLMTRVRAAVERYARDRARYGDHPMIADRPREIDLDSWSLTMRGDGREAWHIHPSGWISGVYYVRMPSRDKLTGAAGGIEFGPFPFGAGRDGLPWPRRTILPESGQLLLFPSYFAHRTWPTGIDEPRTVVAFDVLRAG
jgi:tetratricopeptide (TPR) repeat protein